MNTEKQNNIVYPSQTYAETAKGIAEICDLYPRRTPRLRREAAELETALTQRVAESDLPNLAAVWQVVLNYYNRQLPRHTVTRWGATYDKTEAECLKNWIGAMYDLLHCLDCPTLTSLKIAVKWSRAAGGWTPTVTVDLPTNWHRFTARTPGDYDKLSTAIDKALQQSDTVRKFLIVNWHKIKDCYGVRAYNGLPAIDIAGKGISALESLLSDAGWTNATCNQRIYHRHRGQAEFIGAYYML